MGSNPTWATDKHSAVRKRKSDEAQTFVTCVWVRLPPALLKIDEVVQQVDTRRSERRAEGCKRPGLGVRLSPSSLHEEHCGWTRVQQGLISLAGRVRLPDPLLEEGVGKKGEREQGKGKEVSDRVRQFWMSDEVEGLVFVGSSPTLVTVKQHAWACMPQEATDPCKIGAMGSTPIRSTSGRQGDRVCLGGLLSRLTRLVIRVRISGLPLAAATLSSMVKRTSCLASNETFRVRILVGLLDTNTSVLLGE